MVTNLEQLLGSFNWAPLEHACGPADDLPAILRKACGGTESERNAAFHKLSYLLVHEHSVYSATGPAVEVLCRMLNCEQCPVRADILLLLSRISTCKTYLELHSQHPHVERLLQNDPQYAFRADAETITVQKVRSVFADNLLIFMQMLAEGAYDVRRNAAFLLGTLKAHQAVLRPALARRLNAESDVLTQASILLALGDLKEEAFVFQGFLTDEAPILRWAAAVAMARSLRKLTPEEISMQLTASLLQTEELQRQYDLLPWSYDCTEVGEFTSNALLLTGVSIGEVFQPLLEGFYSVENPLTCIDIAGAMLHLATEGKPVNREVPFPRLCNTLQLILRHLASANMFWTFAANAFDLMRGYGLPSRRELLLSYVHNREMPVLV